MPKIAYDLSKVEDRSFETPKPGTYKAKVHSINDRRPGKNDLEVVVEITEGKYKGSRIWTYLGFGESSAWKLKAFLTSLGLKAKGSFDPDRLKGKTLVIVVTHETYNDEVRARINRFLSMDSLEEDDDVDEDEDDLDEDDDEDEEDDDDEDDEEDEDEEEEPEPPVKKGRKGSPAPAAKGKKKQPEPEPDDEDDLDEDDDEDEEDDEDGKDDDYENWDDDELTEELEARGLSTKGSTKAKIKRLEKDDASSEKPF